MSQEVCAAPISTGVSDIVVEEVLIVEHIGTRAYSQGAGIGVVESEKESAQDSGDSESEEVSKDDFENTIFIAN